MGKNQPAACLQKRQQRPLITPLMSTTAAATLAGIAQANTLIQPAQPTPDNLPPAAAAAPTFAAVSPAYLAAKRTLDVVGAAVALLLFAPIYLLVALFISLRMGGPIFHRRRVLEKQAYQKDKSPRTFDAFKFRTMIPNAEAVLLSDPTLRARYEKEWKLADDPRVTPLGRTLRKWSLDELPQLVNVLRGQMSLVGPRMISPPELAMYGPHAAALLSVKPGLTGLWQVSGRTNVTYRERIRLDMWYIQHRSFLLDVQILLGTVRTVVNRKGAI